MTLKEESHVALKVAHLGMIQGAITRMSGFSASAKTFLVTILAGLAAISLQADKAQLGIVAFLTTTCLFTIDIYYMVLERRFRNLYDHVETRPLHDAADLGIKPLPKSGDIKAALRSTSTKLFYGPVFGACTIFILYGLMHDWWLTPRLPRSAPASVCQLTAVKPSSCATTGSRHLEPANDDRLPAAERSGRTPQPVLVNSRTPD